MSALRQLGEVKMQRMNVRPRVLLVLLMALGLTLGSVGAPVAATEGGSGDDVGTVRAQTLGTIDYKASLLTDLKNSTDNADRKVVYDQGIAELAGLRERAVVEGSIDQLRAMDAEAHDIYHSTKNRASEVGQTEEERIAEVRKATLDTINYKLEIFRNKKSKTDNPVHQEIYAWAVGQLEALKVAAEGSSDIGALKEMKAQAHEIYNNAKARIAEAGGDDGKAEETKKEEPEKTEAEEAAEALAKARRSTQSLIEYKVSLFTRAAEAAKNPVVARVYADAAKEIAELAAEEKTAGTIAALRDIDAKVMEIYDSTKAAVSESHGKPEWQPSEVVKVHIDSVGGGVKRLVEEAASTSEKSPETAKAVENAGAKVLEQIEEVRGAAETGNKLDGKWAEMDKALHNFRKTLGAHVVAVTGGPDCVNGWHLPGEHEPQATGEGCLRRVGQPSEQASPRPPAGGCFAFGRASRHGLAATRDGHGKYHSTVISTGEQGASDEDRCVGWRREDGCDFCRRPRRESAR